MLKAKKYDWKDSNLAHFGSDTEKKVKKEAAMTEKAWEEAGQKVGVKIWRIVKFKVTHWPEEDYGDFYNGDSYIILNTYKKDPSSEELDYDVHFWIGKYSTQDEYGTAAYKTVELDTLLDDKPVQHREVQGHESELFKSYFKGITLLKGGADTGFKRVLPEEYKPRLFHIKRETDKRVTATQVSLKRGNLKDEDVFIIDIGLQIYLWIGVNADKVEKYKGSVEAKAIKGKRPKTTIETLDDQTVNELPDKIAALLKDGASKPKDKDVTPQPKRLFRLSDASGKLQFQEVASGDAVKRSLLKSDDVYIVNTGSHCYCWVGKGASIDERKNGLSHACNYLNKTETPWLPITVVAEGKESDEFNHAF